LLLIQIHHVNAETNGDTKTRVIALLALDFPVLPTQGVKIIKLLLFAFTEICLAVGIKYVFVLDEALVLPGR